ncbi:MAG: ABC transporter permease [Nitrospirae bacterium]|nr:ABC transporter permease [Nitrospirota bacterium]
MLIFFGRQLYKNSYMIRSMVIRDLRQRYVGSMLGIFWSVIHPLTQIMLYYFVFGVVLKMRLGPEYGETKFVFWLIGGLLPWMFFADIITRAPKAVIDQGNLVKKMVFPSEILPIVNIAAALINHILAIAILVVFLVASGQGISPKIYLMMPYLLLLIVFSLGISWLLSSLTVYLRDIGHIIGVIVNIWFYLTPVIYPQQQIPGSLLRFFRLNPMLHIIEGFRTALLGKTSVDITGLMYLLVAGIVILIAGAFTFRKLKPNFADVL